MSDRHEYDGGHDMICGLVHRRPLFDWILQNHFQFLYEDGEGVRTEFITEFNGSQFERDEFMLAKHEKGMQERLDFAH